MEMKAGMKFETEIIVNEGMLANHNDHHQCKLIIQKEVFLIKKMDL